MGKFDIILSYKLSSRPAWATGDSQNRNKTGAGERTWWVEHSPRKCGSFPAEPKESQAQWDVFEIPGLQWLGGKIWRWAEIGDTLKA